MKREFTKGPASRFGICSVLFFLVMTAVPLLAQTRMVPPRNKYKVSDDVRLGRQAAGQIERQLPVFSENTEVDGYAERVGARLVSAIPSDLQRPEFRYDVDVVNARDINAFALPGGFLYINRGMIEAARNEGQMAGVM